MSGNIHILTSGYLELQITREMEKSDNSGEVTDIFETRGETPETLKDCTYSMDDSGIANKSSDSINIDNKLGGTKAIVLDLSQVTFIDTAGVKSVKRVIEQVLKGSGKVAISGAKFGVKIALDNAKVMDNTLFFPTYRDAVEFLLNKQ